MPKSLFFPCFFPPLIFKNSMLHFIFDRITKHRLAPLQILRLDQQNHLHWQDLSQVLSQVQAVQLLQLLAVNSFLWDRQLNSHLWELMFVMYLAALQMSLVISMQVGIMVYCVLPLLLFSTHKVKSFSICCF